MLMLFRKIFGIRRGEGTRAMLMFAYIFLVIASLMIVKPIRNSLFLARFGAGQLPYAYLMVAIVSALFVWLYSRYSKSVRLNYLILYTMQIAIAGFVVAWLLLHFGYRGGWFLYGFYTWVGLFGVISSAQFWLLANYVFDAREAKRTFGFIGAGAISGGILGGYITNYLATIIKTNNLLFICIGFLAICLAILSAVWKKSVRYRYLDKSAYARLSDEPGESGNAVRLILKSRHLTYLAGTIGLGVLAAALVDYQFSAIASNIIVDTDKLTAFFGFWMSNLSVASLIIQLLFTGRILKHLGAVPSLLFLPVGIMIGAAAIIFNPGLWSAILIKVSDGGLKHSINKAGLELSILPIPNYIKNKVKAFIDVFIDSLATGIAGILLLFLTVALGLRIDHISMILAGIIAIWIYLIVRMRKEYINSFRQAIEKRTIDLSEQTVNLQETSILKRFIKYLDGDNERQILYILNLFEGFRGNELIPYLKKLIDHDSNDIKVKVLRHAASYSELDLTSKANELLQAGDERLKTEAIRYLCNRSDDKLATLKGYLQHDDYYIAAAALLYAAREAADNPGFKDRLGLSKIYDRMLSMLEKGEQRRLPVQYFKKVAARVIGIADEPKLHPYLYILLNENSPEILQHAIISAGKTGNKDFIPILIPYLAIKQVRRQARSALAEFGENAISFLSGYLQNASAEYNIRLAIPRVLALIGSPKSARLLSDNLGQQDILLRYEIIKALNKLRNKFPSVKLDRQIIRSRIFSETNHYYEILSVLNYHQNYSLPDRLPSDPESKSDEIKNARKLLVRALEERLDNNLERIFRLLGLRYLPQDMYNAYLGVQSNKSDLQANAIEFLDNVLEPNLKRMFIPIIETRSPADLLEKSKNYIQSDPPTENRCFDFLLNGDDNWLKVCALFLIGVTRNDACSALVAKLINDKDPVVQETAKFCIDKISP